MKILHVNESDENADYLLIAYLHLCCFHFDLFVGCARSPKRGPRDGPGEWRDDEANYDNRCLGRGKEPRGFVSPGDWVS